LREAKRKRPERSPGRSWLSPSRRRSISTDGLFSAASPCRRSRRPMCCSRCNPRCNIGAARVDIGKVAFKLRPASASDPQMNSPGGRREAQAAIIWNRGSCAPTERSVEGFSRLRRRAKRALDRPFGRRVPVTVPNNGGPRPWRLFPESLCDSNCESDALDRDDGG
jgi:hypothetical protein